MATITAQTLHEMLYKQPWPDFRGQVEAVRKMMPETSDERAGARRKILPADLLSESRALHSSKKIEGAALGAVEIRESLLLAAQMLDLSQMSIGEKARYEPNARVLECKPEGLLAIGILGHYFGERLRRSAHVIRELLEHGKKGLGNARPEEIAFALMFVHLSRKGVKPLFSDLRLGKGAAKALLRGSRYDGAAVTQELLALQLDCIQAVYEGAGAKSVES